MPRPTLTLDTYLPYNVAVTSNLVSNLVAAEYVSRFNLKIAEWRVVCVLNQESSTQVALSSTTGMDKVTISRAVQALAKRRLIKRSTLEHDGRSHLVSLTPEGQELFRSVSPLVLKVEAELLSDLSVSDVATLKTLLKKLQTAANSALSGAKQTPR